MIAGYFGGAQVATVGRVDIHPNLVNVVPSTVTFTIDLRNTDDEILKDVEQQVFTACRAYAADEGCQIEMRTLARFQPVTFDDGMIELVESIARQLGHSTKRMPSGAGHDAQMLSRVCPTSMIFVPSVNGLSHNIAEYTTPADVEAGANVLLQALLHCAA
jgi:beta-ureidopropionase / N-carbamoyl-L-amino-acid hydrolase